MRGISGGAGAGSQAVTCCLWALCPHCGVGVRVTELVLRAHGYGGACVCEGPLTGISLSVSPDDAAHVGPMGLGDLLPTLGTVLGSSSRLPVALLLWQSCSVVSSLVAGLAATGRLGPPTTWGSDALGPGQLGGGHWGPCPQEWVPAIFPAAPRSASQSTHLAPPSLGQGLLWGEANFAIHLCVCVSPGGRTDHGLSQVTHCPEPGHQATCITQRECPEALGPGGCVMADASGKNPGC